nr:uncharacterized protein LOC106045268 isoform X3 [Anser cygnoides]
MVIFLKIVFGPALILCYSLVFSSGWTWRLLAWECQWVGAWLQHCEMEPLPPVLSACAGLGLCGGTCGPVLSAEAIKGGVWEHTRPLAPARCLSDLSHYWAASALHSPTAGCVADEALHFSLCLEAVPRPSCCTKGKPVLITAALITEEVIQKNKWPTGESCGSLNRRLHSGKTAFTPRNAVILPHWSCYRKTHPHHQNSLKGT